MDLAICLTDGETYGAVAFSKLPSRQLQQKRRQLVCTMCEAPAFFRKKSRSGQGPCFGARPHKKDCEFSTPESSSTDELRSVEEFALTNTHEIVVDLQFGNLENAQSGKAAGRIAPGGDGQFHSLGSTSQRRAVSHRRLGPLLLQLIHSPQFSASPQRVSVGGFPTMSVKEFFVPFEKVDESMVSAQRGFWGTITDARKSGQSLWLNHGRRGDLSVVIQPLAEPEVLRRCHVDDIDDLAGAYVLVLGRVRRSSNNKLYVRVGDAEYITIRPAQA